MVGTEPPEETGAFGHDSADAERWDEGNARDILCAVVGPGLAPAA